MRQEIIINEPRAIEVIKRTVESKRDHTFIFETQNEFPEEKFIKLTQEIGENNQNYPLNSLFLITPLIRGDNTFNFFERVVNSPLVRENSWIFEPKKVVEADHQGIDVKKICQETLRPGGYSISYLDQWVHNCQILVDRYQGNVLHFFQTNNNSANEIIQKLIVRPRAKTKEKSEFRGFGPKIATLAVQWANQYFIPLKDADLIGVPVDFQISRILIQTGAVDIIDSQNAFQITHRIVLPLIKNICQKEDIKPRDVSESLWLIGSRCCNNDSHDLCPVNDLCTKTISRKDYDASGMFNPTDIRK